MGRFLERYLSSKPPISSWIGGRASPYASLGGRRHHGRFVASAFRSPILGNGSMCAMRPCGLARIGFRRRVAFVLGLTLREGPWLRPVAAERWPGKFFYAGGAAAPDLGQGRSCPSARQCPARVCTWFSAGRGRCFMPHARLSLAARGSPGVAREWPLRILLSSH